MSPSAGGAEDRVGHRVADDVGIRVTERAASDGIVDAAEHQRPAVDQAMQVVAGADASAVPAHGRRRPLARAPSRSAGVVIFRFVGLALDDAHAMPGPLGERRFVGRFDARRAQRHGVASTSRRNACGVCARKIDLARESSRRSPAATAARLDALHRVAHRQRRDRRTVLRRGVDRRDDELGVTNGRAAS